MIREFTLLMIDFWQITDLLMIETLLVFLFVSLWKPHQKVKLLFLLYRELILLNLGMMPYTNGVMRVKVFILLVYEQWVMGVVFLTHWYTFAFRLLLTGNLLHWSSQWYSLHLHSRFIIQDYVQSYRVQPSDFQWVVQLSFLHTKRYWFDSVDQSLLLLWKLYHSLSLAYHW